MIVQFIKVLLRDTMNEAKQATSELLSRSTQLGLVWCNSDGLNIHAQAQRSRQLCLRGGAMPR
jgi:hypothetical protein